MPVRDRFGLLMEGREGLRAKNAKSSVASKYGVELFESEGAEHGITEGREGDVEKEQRWNRIIEREEEEGRRESYLPLSREPPPPPSFHFLGLVPPSGGHCV